MTQASVPWIGLLLLFAALQQGAALKRAIKDPAQPPGKLAVRTYRWRRVALVSLGVSVMVLVLLLEFHFPPVFWIPVAAAAVVAFVVRVYLEVKLSDELRKGP